MLVLWDSQVCSMAQQVLESLAVFTNAESQVLFQANLQNQSLHWFLTRTSRDSHQSLRNHGCRETICTSKNIRSFFFLLSKEGERMMCRSTDEEPGEQLLGILSLTYTTCVRRALAQKAAQDACALKKFVCFFVRSFLQLFSSVVTEELKKMLISRSHS